MNLIGCKRSQVLLVIAKMAHGGFNANDEGDMWLKASFWIPVYCWIIFTACAATAATEEVAPAAPYPAELQARLQAALKAKGTDYQPRTEHLHSDGSPEFTNRLILEDSPYLLQHAHNPVDWFPWGPEAFEKARREDKPIFLSIGYSTCHWCHVMERESFENKAIAQLLNRDFVAIKVDRERRPDVDAGYMTAVMLLTGRGGWPMSSFLTADGKTFYGGTYFPPDGFMTLLQEVHSVWNEDRAGILAQAERVATAVAQTNASRSEARQIGKETIGKAVAAILEKHDDLQGGFSQAPKFPSEPLLFLLLDTALRNGDKEALAAAELSLDAMARGGLYDQVGGGFHRYSTDHEWLVPHFEKMLYNQAHLARLYLQAYRLTGKPRYARIARQTLDYVLRDMRSPQGGFYSATDADSEGKEGVFFLWTPEQIKAVLNPEDADLAIALYGVTPAGNFEHSNILHLPLSLEDYVSQNNLTLTELLERVELIREQLRQAREQRIHPLRDDKILTAWNGMMISTLVTAAQVLSDQRYAQAAQQAGEFIWKHNRREQGKLWRVHLQGSSSVAASQEDYAYLAEGLIHLYDLSGEALWLERAQEVADAMLEQFWDTDAGGFYMNTGNGDTPLMVRPKDSYDGAIPSGNSVAVHVLAMLAARSGREDYRNKANATLAAYSGNIASHPSAYAYMLSGADQLLHGELGSTQYAARGVVTARGELTPGAAQAQRLTLKLQIRPGWHINANQPLQDYLIPTAISLQGDANGWQLGAVDYPQPEIVKLGFQQQALALYQGEVQLQTELNGKQSSTGRATVPVQLRLQACNDEVCLPPENLVLNLSVTN